MTSNLQRDGSINRGFIGDDGHEYAGIDPSDIDARFQANGRGAPQDVRDGGGGAAPARRPNNLKIPSESQSASPKVFKKVQRQRPESTQSHQYEELPFNKDRRNVELKKMEKNVYHPHPNPPPVGNIPSISERVSTDSSRYPNSEFGSDITMIRDGPRKQENPLYDTVKPAKTMSSSPRPTVLWILIIILFLLVLVLFVLVILILSGAIKTYNESAVAKAASALPLAENNEVKISSLQKKVDSLEQSGGTPVAVLNRISTLESNYEQYKSDVISLGTKVKSMESKFSSSINNLQVTSTSLKTLYNDLSSDFKTLFSQIAVLNESVTDHQKFLPCKVVKTSNTQQGITLVDTKFMPNSLDFYKNSVFLSPTCSSEGALSATLKEYKFSNEYPGYKKYGCSCEVPQTSNTAVTCQLNGIVCTV